MISIIPGVLVHKPAIDIISYLRKPKWGRLIIPHLGKHSVPVYSRVSGKGFEFKFRHSIQERSLSVGQYVKRVIFNSKRNQLVLEDFYLGSQTLSFLFATVSRFHTKNFSKKRKYYFRLIIPLKNEMSWFFQIEQSIFKNDYGFRSRSGLTVSVQNENFICCILRDEKKEHFLSIESSIAQSFESFSDKAHSIKNSLGYICGYLAGDNGYYFAYSHGEMKNPIHFCFAELRNSIVSYYTPVYTNPYGYIRNGKLAEKYHQRKLLRHLNSREFSNLCEKTYSNRDFESCLVLIMESSAASLLFMPGGLAIALEALSDVILDNKKAKLAPIKDKPVSDKIRKECKDVINNYSTVIESKDLKVLLSRIEQLNQVTNKARLRAPFDILKISLLEEDLRVLETRNDFLHGRFPDLTSAGPDRSLDRINSDVYYSSLRLYTLISLLILKWIGYDNYVVNYPQIQSKFCKIKLNEKPYRKV